MPDSAAVCHFGGRKGEKCEYDGVCICVFAYICEKTHWKYKPEIIQICSLWGKKRAGWNRDGRRTSLNAPCYLILALETLMVYMSKTKSNQI